MQRSAEHEPAPVTPAQKVVEAESGSPPDRPSVRDLLSTGGGDAEKFRDFIGIPLTIRDYTEVTTKNGQSIQLIATDDEGVEHTIWAPSVVEKQVVALDANGYFPIRLVPTAIDGASGRTYFSLEEPPDG